MEPTPSLPPTRRRRSSTAAIFTLLLSLLTITACVTTKPPTQNFLSSYEGFQEVSGRNDTRAFEGDLTRLAHYDGLYIAPVSVVELPMDEDDPAEAKTTPEERAHLARLLEAALRDNLAQSFTIAAEPGEGILTIRAALDRVRPNSPLLFAAGYAPGVFIVTTGLWAATGENVGAGELTVHLEVVDSVSEERFYALIDREQTGKHEVKSGLSRWGQAEKAIADWSQTLAQTLATGG